MAAFELKGDLKILWIKASQGIPNLESSYEPKKEAESEPDPTAWLQSFQAERYRKGKFLEACSKVGRRMQTIQIVLRAIGFTVDMGAIAFPPISPAGLVVNAFAWLFASFAKVSKAFDQIESLFDKIAQQFNDLMIIKDQLQSDVDPHLQQRIVKLFICCLEIYRIGSDQPKHRLELWTSQLIGDDKLQPAISAFESASKALKSYFNIATWSNVEKMKTAVNKSRDRADRDEIYSWLTTFNHTKMHRFNQEQIPSASGTSRIGRWLLDSDLFKSWEEGDIKKIWYTGNPGAGKSVLASIIIEHLKAPARNSESHQNGRLVAYLYFSYMSKPGIKELLGSVIRQLQQETDTHPAIVDKFESAQRGGKFEGKVEPPTEADLAYMLAEIGRDKAVYIVLDALDEFDYEHREKLLRCIENISNGVRILVTSRVLQHLNTLQEGFSTDKITAHDEDMDEYINCELTSHASTQRFRHMHDEIREQIKQKSGRMFIIARLHMEAICKVAHEEDLNELLRSLPRSPSLFNIYNITMERIRQQNDPTRISRAESVLGWVAFAQRQLTADELRHALAIRESQGNHPNKYLRDTKELISECYGLVIIDSEDMVRFVHRSAREFFDGHMEVILPEANNQITIDCVKYLSTVVTAQPNKATSVDSDADDVTDSMEKEYPLIRYVAEFLHKHHRKIRCPQPEPEIAAIKKFVTQKFTRELYSRLLWKYEAYDSKSIFLHKDMRLVKPGFPGSFDSLQVAVYLGNSKVVENLVDKGADLSVVDAYGRTPIDIAIDCELDSIAGILLQNGAKVDLNTEHGHFILLHAMGRRYLKVVSEIIGSPNHEPGLNHGFLGILGLVMMLFFAQLEVLATFLPGIRRISLPSTTNVAQNPDPDLIISEKYRTLLKLAYEGDVSGLEDLLNPEAYDPIALDLVSQGGEDAQTDDQVSGLQHADTLDNLNQLKKLFLKTACFLAAENDKEKAVCVFLDHGASPNLTNHRGQSLLHRATFNNNYRFVEALLKRDATVDQRDRNGRSALTAYADLKRDTVLNLLLDKNADINLRQKDDIHEIYEAAVFGAKATVEFFLQYRVSPSITNRFGWTPLHGAAANGHLSIVKLLVDHKVDVSPLSDTDDTPLDLVKQGRKHYHWILTGWNHYDMYVADSRARDIDQEAEIRDEIESFLETNNAKTSDKIREGAGPEEFEKIRFRHPPRQKSWWDNRKRHFRTFKRRWKDI